MRSRPSASLEHAGMDSKASKNKQATLLNFLTNLYDYEDPDEERLPPHTNTIPLDWDE